MLPPPTNFPTNYFYLSFGKQDRLSRLALQVKAVTGLNVDAKKTEVFKTTLACLPTQPDLNQDVLSLSRFVPQRFLRPFFANQLKGESDSRVDKLIAGLAETAFADPAEPCLYRFVNDSIEIHPVWFDYLQRHLNILFGFCLWHLINYLQKTILTYQTLSVNFLNLKNAI